MNENEKIKSFYDEDCIENDKGGEWNILFKIHGLKF